MHTTLDTLHTARDSLHTTLNSLHTTFAHCVPGLASFGGLVRDSHRHLTLETLQRGPRIYKIAEKSRKTGKGTDNVSLT